MSFRQTIAAAIAQHGRMVLGVGGDPTFTYTIGNALVGKPELLCIGALPHAVTPFLNMLSERPGLAATMDGEILDVGGAYGLKAIWCGPQAKTDYTNQAGIYLGREDYDLLQLLICDKKGRFPDEPGCDWPYSLTPVLRS